MLTQVDYTAFFNCRGLVICNQPVGGSTPFASSNFSLRHKHRPIGTVSVAPSRWPLSSAECRYLTYPADSLPTVHRSAR
jgi:hypothetical protein